MTEQERDVSMELEAAKELLANVRTLLGDDGEALADAIEKLPEKERIVITLYYLKDLRLKEIGKVINLSESRVSRILAKAEFRLKQFMKMR